MSNLDDLAATLNRREITDDEGQVVGEETPNEEPATQEQTTVKEDATAEKSGESKETPPKETIDSENEPEMVETASDETGKRYVPEDRFKKVWAKMKDYERAIKSAPQPTELPKQPLETKPIDKTDQVEVELLRATLPQFNPDSPDYSRELDELGFAVYQSQPGITRIQAAKKAVEMAKQIQSKVAKVEKEAQTEKSIQSDRGITSRVTSRESTSDVPKEDASPEEIEEWLRANGKW